jgi:hypothetical protein
LRNKESARLRNKNLAQYLQEIRGRRALTGKHHGYGTGNDRLFLESIGLSEPVRK